MWIEYYTSSRVWTWMQTPSVWLLSTLTFSLVGRRVWKAYGVKKDHGILDALSYQDGYKLHCKKFHSNGLKRYHTFCRTTRAKLLHSKQAASLWEALTLLHWVACRVRSSPNLLSCTLAVNAMGTVFSIEHSYSTLMTSREFHKGTLNFNETFLVTGSILFHT